ncbi:MAG: hypothetical protein ACOX2X_01855 [Peptococcia bacterium]
MNNFYNQAVHFGCEMKIAEVSGLRKAQLQAGEKPLITVETTDGQVQGKAVLVAAGAQARELGIKGEKEFRGRGVSYCATL